MPPCFKARFGIKCLIKVPWHVIKHLAKAAFPTAFSAKTLCARGERQREEGAGSTLDHMEEGGWLQITQNLLYGNTPPYCILLALHPACLDLSSISLLFV